jgi:hypothetical protein
MKLTILFVVVVGAILLWWLRSVKPKRSSIFDQHQNNLDELLT